MTARLAQKSSCLAKQCMRVKTREQIRTLVRTHATLLFACLAGRRRRARRVAAARGVPFLAEMLR
eukprot:4573017-Pleurochrysis_carterae.AAC.4